MPRLNNTLLAKDELTKMIYFFFPFHYTVFETRGIRGVGSNAYLLRILIGAPLLVNCILKTASFFLEKIIFKHVKGILFML